MDEELKDYAAKRSGRKIHDGSDPKPEHAKSGNAVVLNKNEESNDQGVLNSIRSNKSGKELKSSKKTTAEPKRSGVNSDLTGSVEEEAKAQAKEATKAEANSSIGADQTKAQTQIQPEELRSEKHLLVEASPSGFVMFFA